MKCLTAASNSDGARVTIQDCVSGQQNQQWVMNNGVNVRVFGNKCLDVTDGKNADGTRLQIWTCSSGNANQMWDYNVRGAGLDCHFSPDFIAGLDQQNHLVEQEQMPGSHRLGSDKWQQSASALFSR